MRVFKLTISGEIVNNRGNGSLSCLRLTIVIGLELVRGFSPDSGPFRADGIFSLLPFPLLQLTPSSACCYCHG